MIKLKNRRQPGPNGFMFHEKRTGWKSWEVDPTTQWDFALLCQRYREHALANPGKALETDPTKIADFLDLANALRYLQIAGADIYVTRTGESAPKPPARNSLGSSVAQVAAGAKITIEWINSGEEAVAPAVSVARAKICVDRDGQPCPQHGKGDWTKYFTEPAAAAIKREYERRKEMQLSTPYDDKLQICDACQCPLKLKVHIPIERARSGLTAEQKAKLDPLCWLLHE